MDMIKALIAHRKRQGISQAKMAGRLGITGLTLSRYESGNRLMPLLIAISYAGELGMELRLVIFP